MVVTVFWGLSDYQTTTTLHCIEQRNILQAQYYGGSHKIINIYIFTDKTNMLVVKCMQIQYNISSIIKLFQTFCSIYIFHWGFFQISKQKWHLKFQKVSYSNNVLPHQTNCFNTILFQQNSKIQIQIWPIEYKFTETKTLKLSNIVPTVCTAE